MHKSAHKSILTMSKLNESKYELLEHSLDLAPSEFVRGKRFSSNEQPISVVKQYFLKLSKNHYRDDKKLLQDHFNKCIQV